MEIVGARWGSSTPQQFDPVVMGPGSRFARPGRQLGGDTMTDHTEPTGRNIVILCDGTGNEISENISNVLKLYRCLRKTPKTQPRQLVYYDPGVGTLAQPSTWNKWKQNFKLVLG